MLLALFGQTDKVRVAVGFFVRFRDKVRVRVIRLTLGNIVSVKNLLQALCCQRYIGLGLNCD